MSTTSNEGGGAFSSTQPSMITVPVNIPLPERMDLMWLKAVSSTKILMGYCNHSLSLDATIMVSTDCPTIGEHVVVLVIT